MKKLLALFILLSMLGFSFLSTHEGMKHHKPVTEENDIITTNSSTELFVPTDGGNKKVTIIAIVTVLITIPYSFYFSFFLQVYRRTMLLTPVFYQSNYVGSSLLKK
jgi:hypothetical protein